MAATRSIARANPSTSPGATSWTDDVRLAISRCAGMSESTTRHRHTIASSTATGSPSTVDAETNTSAQCKVSWTSSRGTRPVKKMPPTPGNMRTSSSRLLRSSPSPTMTSWSSGRAARLKAATTVAGSLIAISLPTETTRPARPDGGAGTVAPVEGTVDPLDVDPVGDHLESPDEPLERARQGVRRGLAARDEHGEQTGDHEEEQAVAQPDVRPRGVQGEHQVSSRPARGQVDRQREDGAAGGVHVHRVVRRPRQGLAKSPEAAPQGAVALDEHDLRRRLDLRREEGADRDPALPHHGKAVLVVLAVGGPGLDDHVEDRQPPGRIMLQVRRSSVRWVPQRS